MPADRTEITEIVTGLAMFGAADLASALATPPPAFGGVGEDRWERLRTLAAEGRYRAEFAAAWANGACFLAAARRAAGPAARGGRVEGPAAPAGRRAAPGRPADRPRLPGQLQVQLGSSSTPRPVDLRRRRAGERRRGRLVRRGGPEATQALYEIVRFETGPGGGPAGPGADLSPTQRRELAAALGKGAGRRPRPPRPTPRCPRRWRPARPAAGASAAQRASREATLWRFLRVAAATYFVLGSDGSRMVRLRVGSPWDWRQSFRLRRFDVEPAARPASPRSTGGHGRRPRGRRAAHGRGPHRDPLEPRPLRQPPEAKVYLDTPHHLVPGYWPLA